MNIRSVKDIVPFSFDSRSHEIVGDICVLNLKGFNTDQLKIIGEAFLSFYPKVRTVVNVNSETSGEFRTRSFKFLAGERNFLTVHRENGFRFKVRLDKVYFSPRLQNERLRVLNQVKKGEVVIDLFAGVGPFIIPVSKKCRQAFAVEKNPFAFKLLEENTLLNKAQVNCVKGDASRVKLPNADRFIMNLPASSSKFLKKVFRLANPGAVVHYYSFSHESELFENSKSDINSASEKFGRKVKFLDFVKAGNTGPGWFRNCTDFKIY